MSVLNINVGVLGHVDSGKTSLAKALSTVSSTAAFDKNPQSKERGITLDLGFSSFSLQEHKFKDSYESLQFTLVDCPGHASLIRTIIGGAQILDLMMLVVDIQKGIQTQTAECLVIGEITCDTLIVVLNKVDMIPEAKRSSVIEKMSKRLKMTLQNTKFRDAPIVPVAACPGEASPLGLDELINTLNSVSYVPKRDPNGPFLFAVDHCFSIRGQGTIMTGTVLQGSLHINDSVEISSLKETRKVKGIQMFKRSVEAAVQGDRVGVCVTQFDAKLLERGIVSTPKTVPVIYAAIMDLNKIAYYKGEICTKSKFHMCLGHETLLARVTLFGNDEEEFSMEDEFVFMEKYRPVSKEGESEEEGPVPKKQYVLVEFERPVSAVLGSRVLGTKLDTDIYANMCRLAFHGRIIVHYGDKNYAREQLPRLRVFKNKTKEGIVDRINNDYEVICRGMFKKETNIASFSGLDVRLSTGEKGKIEGGFGQSGKFKVALNEALSVDARNSLDKKKRKSEDSKVVGVNLDFKRYIFDPQKKIIQGR